MMYISFHVPGTVHDRLPPRACCGSAGIAAGGPDDPARQPDMHEARAIVHAAQDAILCGAACDCHRHLAKGPACPGRTPPGAVQGHCLILDHLLYQLLILVTSSTVHAFPGLLRSLHCLVKTRVDKRGHLSGACNQTLVA